MTDDTMSLLDAMIEDATEVAQDRPAATTTIVVENGITWNVDTVTGLGQRVTPLSSRPAFRKPVATTRQFPVDDHSKIDLKAMLGVIAADAFKSQMLVHLLAGAPPDRQAAVNELARHWPGSPAGEREKIVEAYAQLKEQRR